MGRMVATTLVVNPELAQSYRHQARAAERWTCHPAARVVMPEEVAEAGGIVDHRHATAGRDRWRRRRRTDMCARTDAARRIEHGAGGRPAHRRAARGPRACATRLLSRAPLS